MVLDILLAALAKGSYLAVFIVSFISTSSIIIPIVPFGSSFTIITAVGLGLNPFLVAITGGIGSAIGELFGYLVGIGGSAAIEKFEKKVPRFLKKLERFYSNVGFWTILVFSFLPFPFDIIGVLSGASKYNMKKFLVAVTIGRIIRSLLIAYGIIYAVPFVLSLST